MNWTSSVRNRIVLPLVTSFWIISVDAQIRNFTTTGEQITKFDNRGDAVDAHDGMIAYFDGIYYLYGTSYDCGFEWQNNSAPFCGFKSYSSKDMTHWKDEGFLFDAQNELWQSRCDGKTYGCFRPHVVYNRKDKQYVLWINVYDNVVGYRVFTSRTPVGPFVEVSEPKVAINNDKPAAGLNNGDHDVFVDDDGTAYLAMTDWRATGAIAIEQLTDDYLSGTGKFVLNVTEGKTEAPGLFKRKGIYYVTYSDPNCGYCSGTGTSYKTAKSPLGQWSEGKKISPNSCGGQPSFVATLKLSKDTVLLYGSDLWNNAAKNEALANFYWAPLAFEEDGSIKPMDCLPSFQRPGAKAHSSSDNVEGYRALCDITSKQNYQSSFAPDRSGKLVNVDIVTLKSGNPDADLIVDFYEVGSRDKVLTTVMVPRNSIGWSAKSITIRPNIAVSKRKKYVIVLRTDSNTGCYGYAKNVTSNTIKSGKNFKYSTTVK
ncbi:MAG: family 43 glycosylhydrolase [Chryseolinea sp.]